MKNRLARTACFEDSECPSGFCISGECAPGIGGGCLSHRDCLHLGVGVECAGGVCKEGTEKKIGLQKCTVLSECSRGFYCSRSGNCIARVSRGKACALDELPSEICEEGYVCIDTNWLLRKGSGECRQKCSRGQHTTCPAFPFSLGCTECAQTGETFCSTAEQKTIIPFIFVVLVLFCVFLGMFVRHITRHARRGTSFFHLSS